MIISGNCLDVLKTLAANSIDAIVTDPPYALQSQQATRQNMQACPQVRTQRGFMGKEWDSDIAFRPDVWRECWRVLKPGGHMAAMGSTRTFHRLVCAIEDAGFEIRDTVVYCFGSGFPKSLNITKAIKQKLGDHALCVCDLHCSQTTEDYQDDYQSYRDCDDELPLSDQDNDLSSVPLRDDVRGHNHDDQQTDDLVSLLTNISPDENSDRLSSDCFSHQLESLQSCPSVDISLFDKPLNMCKEDIDGKARHSKASRKHNKSYSDDDLLSLKSNLKYNESIHECIICGKIKVREGIGSALKPALELICIARKPLDGTIAENVLKHGTGGINIDACRVGTEGATRRSRVAPYQGGRMYQGGEQAWRTGHDVIDLPFGRFPANLIHDGSDEVIELFPQSKSCSSPSSATPEGTILGGKRAQGAIYPGEDGSAARYFKTCAYTEDERRLLYCAKPSRKERNKGLENHISWDYADHNLAGLMVDIHQLAKDISDDGWMDNCEWNTILYGSSTTDQFQKAMTFIIETTSRLITELKTLNCSPSSIINDTILDAIRTIEANGSNLAGIVELTEKYLSSTSDAMASHLGASLAVLRTLSQIRKLGKTGCSHPTVKPISLMRYLCTLITPAGGTILDPFTGSGSTGCAAAELGYEFVGIELEPEYIEIAERRIKAHSGRSKITSCSSISFE